MAVVAVVVEMAAARVAKTVAANVCRRMDQHSPSCDHCDSCGNHQGQTCQACRPILSGFASLWGYRRDPGCGGVSCPPMTCGCDSCSSGCDSCGSCDGGCDSCGGGGCSSCGHGASSGETMMDGEYIVEEPYAMSGSRPVPMQPTHAAQIVEARPSIKPLPASTHQADLSSKDQCCRCFGPS